MPRSAKPFGRFVVPIIYIQVSELDSCEPLLMYTRELAALSLSSCQMNATYNGILDPGTTNLSPKRKDMK